MNRPPTPGSPLAKPEPEETIQSIPEGSRASQLGPRRPEGLSPGSQNTITSTGTDRSIRPYISKIGVLPSSLPSYHKAFMEARKAGKGTKISPPQIDEHSGPHVQSTAEQAETARRLKPHSRSQLKLEEAKKPAGMTPVPAKKSRPTKWQFGIRSRNQPLEAIGCIYRALQKLGAEWVVDEDYRPKDRDGRERYVKGTVKNSISTNHCRDQNGSFVSNDGDDGGSLHHANSMGDGERSSSDMGYGSRDSMPNYKLPADPWVLRVRWRKDGMYPPGTVPPGSTHSSTVDLRRHSIASFSSTGGSLSSTEGLTSTHAASEPTDAVVMHLDIQLYEMEPGVYLVDFKCAGYETAEGTLLEEKDVTSPFPFLDLASKLIIQLAEAD
jgi:carbon catabolite-derepressing protein kinase